MNEMELEFDFDSMDLTIPEIDVDEKTDGTLNLDISALAAKFNKRQKTACRPCYATDRKTMHFKADNSITAAWKNHRQIWVNKARKNGRFLVERANVGEYFLFKTSAEARAFVIRMGSAYKEVAV